MKSGLEGRNNQTVQMINPTPQEIVSMKSGLEGRNNVVGGRGIGKTYGASQ